jgi:signal recognition particle GTPase
MKLAQAPRFTSQTIDVPPGYPQPAGLVMALIGMRGSSKTTLAARLIHLYFAKGYWNRLFPSAETTRITK